MVRETADARVGDLIQATENTADLYRAPEYVRTHVSRY